MKSSLASFLAFAILAVTPIRAAEPQGKQPVLILMSSRFEDYTQLSAAENRLRRILPALAELRQKYPGSQLSSVLQFSGAMSHALSSPIRLPLVQLVQDAQRSGLVEVGYAGEWEPTPRSRPLPNFIRAESPEDRWNERSRVAGWFLSAGRDVVTGEPFPGVTGGLKRMQEVFGEAVYLSGLTQKLGGDSPLVNQLRQYNQNGILLGIPDADPARGVHGFRPSATKFSGVLSPEPEAAREVYWEDNRLRSSASTSADVRTYLTDEGPDALKAAFEKINRSKVRVIHLEYGSYLRYLALNSDGQPRFHPLQWLWDHPQETEPPPGLKSASRNNELAAAFAKEKAAMQWLLEDFLPNNPGSRFVSAADLKKMAQTPLGAEFTTEQIRQLASDLLARYAETGGGLPPNFARAGSHYLSLADSFQLLAGAFAAPGQSVKLLELYGPLHMDEQHGPVSGEVTARAVSQSAAALAARLRNTAWNGLPANAVPNGVRVGGADVNAAQFLRLMAQATLAPSPETKLKVEPCRMFSVAAEVYPKQILPADQGNTWTYRPAPLSLAAASKGLATGKASAAGF